METETKKYIRYQRFTVFAEIRRIFFTSKGWASLVFCETLDFNASTYFEYLLTF